MLVIIKAGSTIDGQKIDHDTPQEHPAEIALEFVKQGIAKHAVFDASGWLEMDRTYGAQLVDGGLRIDVCECGDRLFSLPADYPPAYLPDALATWLHGGAIGEGVGRIKLQSEFKRLMGVPE